MGRDVVFVTSGAMILAGAVLSGVTILGPVPDGLTFSGIVLLGGVIWLVGGRRLSLASWILVASCVGIYVIFVFSGFGRLRLVALALALAFLLGVRWKSRVLKVLLLLALPIAMFVLSAARIALVNSLYGSPGAEIDSVLIGFLSAISPIYTFSELLQIYDLVGLDLGLGSTFIASVVTFVPRVLWPDKPKGFGAELTDVVSPELSGTGHSEAALLHGEFFYNFGFPGLFLMIFLLGLAFRYLDRVIEHVAGRPVEDLRALFTLVGLACLVSGIVDLYWVGTFTYVARTGVRIAVLGIVYLMLVILLRREPRGGV